MGCGQVVRCHYENLLRKIEDWRENGFNGLHVPCSTYTLYIRFIGERESCMLCRIVLACHDRGAIVNVDLVQIVSPETSRLIVSPFGGSIQITRYQIDCQ